GSRLVVDISLAMMPPFHKPEGCHVVVAELRISIPAATESVRKIKQRRPTMPHSSAPLPASGFTLKMVSLQSGHADVRTARAAAAPAMPISTQNRVRRDW